MMVQENANQSQPQIFTLQKAKEKVEKIILE